MSENLQIIHRKLDFLARMRADIEYSTGKMSGPLIKIKQDDIASLDPDERETISAFTARFASYQEQIGKMMRSIAIEEESPTTPFGAILALMEKLEIIDDAEKWKEIRDLRNIINHDYEDDAQELFQVLSKMVQGSKCLIDIHSKMQEFVNRTYQTIGPR